MAIITKISVQKKAKDRYNIFLDDGNGERYAFSIDEDVLIKYQLKKGMEVDEFSLTEVIYQDDIRKAYSSAVSYLATRMRSEYEVRQYLHKKEVDSPIIQEVIHKLYRLDFLNDKEYAIAYVRTQMNTTDKGKELIRRELKEKKIMEEGIEEALIEYSAKQELEKAQELTEKYFSKNKKDSSRLIKQKMEQLLHRKGYPFDVIERTLSTISSDKNQEDELNVLKQQGEKIMRKYHKYSGYEFKQKVKQALYQKGFDRDLIEQFLREQTLDD